MWKKAQGWSIKYFEEKILGQKKKITEITSLCAVRKKWEGPNFQ